MDPAKNLLVHVRRMGGMKVMVGGGGGGRGGGAGGGTVTGFCIMQLPIVTPAVRGTIMA
jgi:hypothetical protein